MAVLHDGTKHRLLKTLTTKAQQVRPEHSKSPSRPETSAARSPGLTRQPATTPRHSLCHSRAWTSSQGKGTQGAELKFKVGRAIMTCLPEEELYSGPKVMLPRKEPPHFQPLWSAHPQESKDQVLDLLLCDCYYTYSVPGCLSRNPCSCSDCHGPLSSHGPTHHTPWLSLL